MAVFAKFCRQIKFRGTLFSPNLSPKKNQAVAVIRQTPSWKKMPAKATLARGLLLLLLQLDHQQFARQA
jgi:hypothetical protein